MKASRIFNAGLLTLLLVSLAFVSVLPARALEGCQVVASVDDSVVPVEATINVIGVDGTTMLDFGDYSPQAIGNSFVHDYFGEGRFKITAVVNAENGVYRCHAYIDTTAGTMPHTVGLATATPTTAYVLPVGNVDVDENLWKKIDSGNISGSDNIAPDIIGNNNNITIKQQPEVTATPVPVVVNIRVFIPTQAPTVQVASTSTTPKTFWWELLHAFLQPITSFDRWIMEHHAQ